MKTSFGLVTSLSLAGALLLATSPAYGDEACNAEVAAIQPVLSAPGASVKEADLEQATILFKVLKEQCTAGSTLEDVSAVSKQIRALLNMEGA